MVTASVHEGSSTETKVKTCGELATAINEGGMGATVEKHQKLILQYYADVQNQAMQSFRGARNAAYVGFGVLIITWLYTLIWIPHTLPANGSAIRNPQVSMGVVSGVLIEFIAGVQFWLYAKASKQFGYFHVCLERSNRYLTAYKIAEATGSRKEQIMGDLACIMANAPMLPIEEIEVKGSQPVNANPKA